MQVCRWEGHGQRGGQDVCEEVGKMQAWVRRVGGGQDMGKEVCRMCVGRWEIYRHGKDMGEDVGRMQA